MRKAAASAVIVAIVLLIVATPRSEQAQQAVPVPGGDALQAKAERVRDALTKGTVDGFLAELAPWIQGRVQLAYAEMPMEFEKIPKDVRDNFGEEWAKKGVSPDGADPADMLKLKTTDDWLKLRPAQLVGMSLGYYRLHGLADAKERLNSNWLLVDRFIGFEQFQIGSGKGAKSTAVWATRTRGRVTFMNAVHRDGFIVSCVAEGDAWQVEDVEYRVGEVAGQLSKVLPEGRWNRLRLPKHVIDAMRAEGEQMLGSMKGQARVTYAKQGSEANIKRLVGASGGCGVANAELTGKYCKVRDQVVSSKTSGSLLVEPMEGYEDIGYCVMAFKWDGGEGKFTWYDTLDEVCAAHPDFKQ